MRAARRLQGCRSKRPSGSERRSSRFCRQAPWQMVEPNNLPLGGIRKRRKPPCRLDALPPPNEARSHSNLAPGGSCCLQCAMPRPRRYTPEHAKAGLDADFPEIETWPNQFPGYEIVVDDPEFTSVCPKTGLPDFGVLTIRYMPAKDCLELKSLKEYLQSYRNLGIFQENIVNQVLEDVVRWARPVWAEVKGEFRPRGGISTVVVARWPRPKK